MTAFQIAGMIALAVFIVDSVFNVINKKLAEREAARLAKEAEEREKM